MDVTIYHNPACGTSRNTLALIRAAGIEPKVVEYLKTPPTRDELARMIADAGLTVRQAIREKGTPYAELGLDSPDLTDEQLLDAMLMRILGRWMRMITIPNQSSVARAYQEFDADGRMKPSSYYDRVVDVCEELVKFTILTRDASSYLTDRYSERKEDTAKLESRVKLKSI